MITLYHAPRSRSSAMVWLLEELGVEYTRKVVSIRRFDREANKLVGERDPGNPHPHGKVPVIDHDGTIVYESIAIAQYLTDAFPDAGIGPTIGDAKRGAYLSWLAYYAGVFEPSLAAAFFDFHPPESTVGWAPAADVMGHVNETLNAGPYLLGDGFSAVDVFFGGTFALFMGSPLVPAEEPIAGYVARVTERPAYQRVKAIDADT